VEMHAGGGREPSGDAVAGKGCDVMQIELTQDHGALATLGPQPYVDRDLCQRTSPTMLNRGQMKELTQDHGVLATLGPQPYIDRDPVPKNKSNHAE
jgi:hypothetical protein